MIGMESYKKNVGLSNITCPCPRAISVCDVKHRRESGGVSVTASTGNEHQTYAILLKGCESDEYISLEYILGQFSCTFF